MKSLIDLLEAYPVKEEKEMPPYKIYCDMDGVLTDFDRRFEHFTGMTPDAYTEKYGRSSFWKLIDKKVGDKFWSGMEWMPGGKKLWDFISPYNPTILTSPSYDKSSEDGKKVWCKEKLGLSEDRVIFAGKKPRIDKFSNEKKMDAKYNYASKDAILIDDSPENIDPFNQKGGIGIICKDGNVDQIIKELQELGYE